MGDNGGHDLIFLSLLFSSTLFPFSLRALETRNEEVGRGVGPTASLNWIGATG